MYRFNYAIFLSLFSLSACVLPNKKAPLHEFLPLLGIWERNEQNSQFVEHWQEKNDSSWQAFSIETEKGDTVFSESVELVARGKDIFYIVSVPGQNAEAPVSFRLVSRNPWVFENKAHDFPKRIVYSLPSLDSLHAWIEGDDNRADFKMTRRKK
jgi:hypothetical protein